MNETIPAIDPAHSALLVMDYQAAIVGSIPESDELLARVAAAISTARDCGVQIGYVRVALDDADYAAIPDTNKRFTEAAASRLSSPYTGQSHPNPATSSCARRESVRSRPPTWTSSCAIATSTR
jgi:nicotinamidase-related amidase